MGNYYRTYSGPFGAMPTRIAQQQGYITMSEAIALMVLQQRESHRKAGRQTDPTIERIAWEAACIVTDSSVDIDSPFSF